MPDIQEMEPFSTLWLNVTPETWSRELQGSGRWKDVASSLASCWDLLSVRLEADWADWPHFAPYAGMGPACHIRWGPPCDGIAKRAAHYPFTAHHPPEFANIGARNGCRSATGTILQVKFIFCLKNELAQLMTIWKSYVCWSIVEISL